MRKRNNIKGQKIRQGLLAREITRLLQRHPKKRFNARQIIKKLKIDNNSDSIKTALSKLEEEKVVVESTPGKYRINGRATSQTVEHAEGIVDMTQRGSAYIICDDIEQDVLVQARDLNNALNGDTVQVAFRRRQDGKRPTGEITKVIKRHSDYIIGILHMKPKYAYVMSDKYHSLEIFIPLTELHGAKDEEKVVVQITEWPNRKSKKPIGTVTEILGKVGSSDIEMKSILINNGFELSFPKEVLDEAAKLTDEITAEELTKRRDFREVTTFTIDPETAKDFDDALSIQYLENGHCEIGVHIADVTHYIQANSALDNEALKRSTSVYLVGQVLPMLPEKISNELCSLRPDEDKFTFSAVFEFDKDDKIIKEWFGKTLIHSNRRFTYEEAQEVLETGEGDYAAELKQMNRIAYQLRKEKFKNGAINFDSPETAFKLDENNEVIGVYVKQRKDAHLLIEDFMLLANRKVATYMHKPRNEKPIPFVYRVHDLPDMEKVEDFARFAHEMGYKFHVDTPKQIAKAFADLNKAAEERPELKMLGPLAIRSMAKAEYTPKNIGHYGLAFADYTHFTSPIRRYSDVLVHRILNKNLENRRYRMNEAELTTQCKHISAQERKAMTAERESIKYKQTEFMEKHIGEEFEGIISGMMNKGIFVKLNDNGCEGMVRFETMSDVFVVSDNRLKAFAKSTGTTLKIGDTVHVKVVDTNLDRREVEMELLSE